MYENAMKRPPFIFFDDSYIDYHQIHYKHSFEPTKDIVEWNSILQLAKKSNQLFQIASLKKEDIVLLIPTSGYIFLNPIFLEPKKFRRSDFCRSSGIPKLVIFTDRMMNCSGASHPSTQMYDQSIVFSFDSLRQWCDVLCKGGRIGCYSGNSNLPFYIVMKNDFGFHN